MTRRYVLEVLPEDEGLIDQLGDASFTMAARTGDDDVEFSVLETLDEALATDWRQILDDSGRPYVSRVLEANDAVSEQRVRNPSWRTA
ncbi:hypothetical protein SBC1_26260 [Caballeronia sp. SBC1]|uniref:hypothetical protein n=1 Tax=Caballeronia sp. SBC1 TaxID=2705548 RepID=UPI0014080BB9|nr:hypothetical protein [Caballeronia sp. SBC1]QIN62610.1 hypothetical protein SBC1_26260 [Caballeronia sp. SBC1]